MRVERSYRAIQSDLVMDNIRFITDDWAEVRVNVLVSITEQMSNDLIRKPTQRQQFSGYYRQEQMPERRQRYYWCASRNITTDHRLAYIRFSYLDVDIFLKVSARLLRSRQIPNCLSCACGCLESLSVWETEALYHASNECQHAVTSSAGLNSSRGRLSNKHGTVWYSKNTINSEHNTQKYKHFRILHYISSGG